MLQDADATISETKTALEAAKKAVVDAIDKADKLETELDIVNGRLETVIIKSTGWPKETSLAL